MRITSKILCSAALAFVPVLNSCSSRGVFSTPLYLAVTISPRPASVPVGGSVVLAGTASNNLGTPMWSLLNAAAAPGVGSLTAVTGSPNSILYTAPATPPIYNNSVPAGFTQGTVTIQAALAPPLESSLPEAYDSITVFITTPKVALSAVSPSAIGVVLGGTQPFTAYETGNINTALTWQVNGVIGGSSTTGTISVAGIYTAPAQMPMAGNTVTITVIPQADPTQSASATVTLTI